MSNSDIIVNVWLDSDEVEKGILGVRDDEVLIYLDSGVKLSSNNQSNVLYSVRSDSLLSQYKIRLCPTQITTHYYTEDFVMVSEDIFPPSSGGFYGRLRAGRERVRFYVQNILNDEKTFLIIGNSSGDGIHEVQIIHPYEAEALKLHDNTEIQELWDSHIWSDKKAQLEEEILRILDESSPSWDTISKLTTGVTITDMKRGKTVRETLNQLVPDSFSAPIRNQLMAFLALVMTDRIKTDNLIDSSSYIYAEPMFSALLQGHLRCIIDKVPWPPYLKLILQSSEGRLEQPKRSLAESESSERFLWQKLNELFPNWLGNAVDSAQELNQSMEFNPRLPVTKSRASRSRKLRKKRLASIIYGLKIRGHVNSRAIGLSDLVYIGAAYRWPHRHMGFITRLGLVSENPPHLQVMTLPQSSAERVVRALPQSIKIHWSTRTVNLDLFDEMSNKWEIPLDTILESMTKSGSKKRLVRRFGVDTNREMHQITSDEAKVLGLVSRGIYLEDFEFPEYFRYWDLERKQVSSIISKLWKRGVVRINFEVDDYRLVSLASIVQGTSNRVCSFLESLLTHAPTSLVWVNEQYDKGVVISRFPDHMVYDLAAKLNQYGIQEDLVIRCMRPRSYRSFNFRLYERLLRPDGTWDDDVSAFLSQARSKRRELSKSNA